MQTLLQLLNLLHTETNFAKFFFAKFLMFLLYASVSVFF